MIFGLVIITAFFTYFAYHNSKLKLLSPTFWTSGMFMSFSLIYAITIYNMKSDISLATFLIIVGFLTITASGEYIGRRIRIGRRLNDSELTVIQKNRDLPVEIYIKPWKSIALFGIYMIVAIDRYRHLAAFASAYGSFSNFMQMISVARRAYVKVNGSVILSNTLFNQIVYICEITAYIMIFIFLHNWICCKKKNWYLLLPLIPDLVIRLLSTSRTGFMILLIAVIVAYFVVLWKEKRLKIIHISYKLILGVVAFVVVFLIYGRVRNNAQSIPVISYIQMYTCSSLYGLNDIIENGWEKNPYFGFNTLQNIYNTLGITHESVSTWLKMTVFSKDDFHSNVYTSLYDVIIDYGVLGMYFVRFLTAVISSKIITKFVNSSCYRYDFYYLIYFAIVCTYCYFYSATGDVFMDYFFNPKLMIRYLIYGYFLVRFFLKPSVRNKSI